MGAKLFFPCKIRTWPDSYQMLANCGTKGI